MSIPDFQFDPPTGHNNTEVFPEYPARDQVRPLFQRLFDQIRDFINTSVKGTVNTHLAETVAKVISIVEPWGQLTLTTVNLGFRPKAVTVDSVILNTIYESTGYIDDSTQLIKHRLRTPNVLTIQTGFAVIFQDAAGGNNIAGIVTFTDTGFTITWSNSGILSAGAGNRRLIITALTHGGA